MRNNGEVTINPSSYYKISYVEDVLCVDRATLYRDHKAGKLRFHRRNIRSTHIRGSELINWLEGREPAKPQAIELAECTPQYVQVVQSDSCDEWYLPPAQSDVPSYEIQLDSELLRQLSGSDVETVPDEQL